MIKHIHGVEKFLEVLDKIKEKELFTILDEDSLFIENIFKNKSPTNYKLYEHGIVNSLLLKKMNTILKSYGKWSFYVNYKNYKEKLKIDIF